MRLSCFSLLFIVMACNSIYAAQPVAAPSAAENQMFAMAHIDPDTLLPIYMHPNHVPGAVYADPNANPSDRVADLLRRLTFEEKLFLTGGWNRFMLGGMNRLGVRAVSMADGGQGVRLKTSIIKTKSTVFPATLALAATWNRELATGFGKSLGEECRALGVDVLLGPGANMQRLSVGGRNFEYLGEDPFLTRSMVVEYILALQDEGPVVVPKHFIGNDQDFCRHIASSQIDERTLREIYLVPWEGIYKDAECLGMMTGNNLVNGTPTFMHRWLIDGILRTEYGFRGMAMTDWQNSSYYPAWQEKIMVSGETLMMPDNNALMLYLNEEIAESPQRRAEIEILAEKMVANSLYALFASGVYDRPYHAPSYYDTFESHKQIVRTLGEEAITMLKNDGILPVPASKKVLLTGTKELACGSGSGFVIGYDHVDFETGLRNVYGNNLTYSENPSDKQIEEADVVLFSLVKDTGEGRDIPFDEPADQIAELRRVSKLSKNVIVLITSANNFPMDWAKDVSGILWCYFLGQERGNALAGVISGKVSPSGKLPFTLERSFADSPAPRYNYLGGKPYWRGNNEYRSYWLGLEPKTTKDNFSDMVAPGEILEVPYHEGIFMGYRWYDRNNIPVMYPFGYGLSYTDFEYTALNCDDKLAGEGFVTVNVTLRNKGKADAKETVQLYVTDVQCSVERPAKELKGFEKVFIPAGAEKTITMKLDRRAFSFWDTALEDWKTEPGDFKISVGGSSADLPLTRIINIR